MSIHVFLRTVIAAGAIAFSAIAIAADAAPVVAIQITVTGVAIEGRTYGSGDVEALRAKLGEIRVRVPKPDLSLDLADGLSDAQGEAGMDLLFKAGFEQDIEEHTRN